MTNPSDSTPPLWRLTPRGIYSPSGDFHLLWPYGVELDNRSIPCHVVSILTTQPTPDNPTPSWSVWSSISGTSRTFSHPTPGSALEHPALESPDATILEVAWTHQSLSRLGRVSLQVPGTTPGLVGINHLFFFPVQTPRLFPIDLSAGS